MLTFSSFSKFKYLSSLFTFLALFSVGGWAESSKSILRQIDSKLYAPQKVGIKDFYLLISDGKMASDLTQMKNYGNVKTVKYHVYWIYPGTLTIDVEGLPNGMTELEKKVKASVLPKIKLIFPESLESQLKGRMLSLKKTSNKYIISAKAKEYTGPVSEVIIESDKDFKLTKISTKRPTGTETSFFDFERFDKAAGLFVLKEIRSSSFQGALKTISKTEVKYDQGSEYLAVKRIAIDMEQQLQSQKGLKEEINHVLNIEEFKINQNVSLNKMNVQSKH